MRLLPLLGVLHLMLACWGYAQTAVVCGKVMTEDGVPLVGTTIRIEGYSYGARTRADGSFIISGVRLGEFTLLVTTIGYEPYREMIYLSEGSVSESMICLSPRIGFVFEGCFGRSALPTRVGTIRTITYDDLNTGTRPTLFGGGTD